MTKQLACRQGSRAIAAGRRLDSGDFERVSCSKRRSTSPSSVVFDENTRLSVLNRTIVARHEETALRGARFFAYAFDQKRSWTCGLRRAFDTFRKMRLQKICAHAIANR